MDEMIVSVAKNIGYNFAENDGIGRHGEVTSKSIILEVARFYKAQPMVYRVVGLDLASDDVSIKLRKIPVPYEEKLSGGGNGRRNFAVEAGNIYSCDDVLYSGGRKNNNELVLVASEGVCVINDNEDKLCLLKNLFESDYNLLEQKRRDIAKLKKMAATVRDNIIKERLSNEKITIDNITAQAEFGDVPSVDEIVRAISSGKNMDEYIALYTIPRRFVVFEPAFAAAENAEEAIQKARALVAERAAAAERALAEASEAGLPQLVGTPKQIAWALQIRSNLYNKNPNHPALKKEANSQYWIQNRFNLI